MGESLHAIVLAGGSGTRLWPLSRGELPKQFLHLFGNESLFQGTLKRLRPLAGERIKVISPGCFSDLVLQQSGAAGLDQKSLLLVEPCAKNTAPAIALGIATLVEEGCTEDTPVLVCPSDHVINEDEKFIQAVRYGLEAISEGAIVVFGIAPKSLETGFGYIRAGESRGSWFRVDEFVEKPDAKRAAALLDEGGWFWNGGIFLFRLGDILDAFRAHLPRIGELLQGGVINLLDQYNSFPSISIDYGIIERYPRMAVVPLDAGWADLGSWDAFYSIGGKDEQGNVISGDVITEDCTNCLFRGNGRLVAAVGLNDILVVDSPDALCISARGISQKVRTVAEKLRNEKRREVFQAPESVRSWGEYRIVYEGDGIKIKRIRVLPGKSLSLQYHHHRSEHWIVVSGTAKITRENENFFLHEGESAFIGKHQVHRLANPGKLALEIIEVQNGSYLGEDDIVRLKYEEGGEAQ